MKRDSPENSVRSDTPRVVEITNRYRVTVFGNLSTFSKFRICRPKYRQVFVRKSSRRLGRAFIFFGRSAFARFEPTKVVFGVSRSIHRYDCRTVRLPFDRIIRSDVIHGRAPPGSRSAVTG